MIHPRPNVHTNCLRDTKEEIILNGVELDKEPTPTDRYKATERGSGWGAASGKAEQEEDVLCDRSMEVPL